MIVGPGGYIAYLKFGYFDHMPSNYVSSLHLYPSLLVAAFGFYTYYQAVNTDAGVITRENAKQYIEKYAYANDDYMFPKDSVCTTCKTKK
jgi:hypothetical protein